MTTAEPADDVEDGFSDDDLARMADAALAAVGDQRDRTHDASRLALLALLAQIAATINHQTVLGAYVRGAARPTNRAAVAAALIDAVDAAGLGDAWIAQATDAHHAAVSAGAAAAMHVLTAGQVPVDPTILAGDDDDPRFDPVEWIADQAGALAGDIVDALDRAEDDDDGGGVNLTALLAAGAGADLIGDQQLSDAYLLGSVLIYAALDVPSLWWNAMNDACPICLGLQEASPYARADLPETPHPRCRCWATPGEAG